MMKKEHLLMILRHWAERQKDGEAAFRIRYIPDGKDHKRQAFPVTLVEDTEEREGQSLGPRRLCYPEVAGNAEQLEPTPAVSPASEDLPPTVAIPADHDEIPADVLSPNKTAAPTVPKTLEPADARVSVRIGPPKGKKRATEEVQGREKRVKIDAGANPAANTSTLKVKRAPKEEVQASRKRVKARPMDASADAAPDASSPRKSSRTKKPVLKLTL
jgi:hypothetical protein